VLSNDARFSHRSRSNRSIDFHLRPTVRARSRNPTLLLPEKAAFAAAILALSSLKNRLYADRGREGKPRGFFFRPARLFVFFFSLPCSGAGGAHEEDVIAAVGVIIILVF